MADFDKSIGAAQRALPELRRDIEMVRDQLTPSVYPLQAFDRIMSALAARESRPAVEGLTDAVQAALDAYENRFESINGNYNGPIDESMRVLAAALAAAPKTSPSPAACW